MKTRHLALLILAVGICWGILSRGSQAQLTLPKVQDETLVRIGLRVNDFLNDVSNDNLDEGLEKLLARSPLLKDSQRVAKLKESVQRATQKNGNFTRVEPLKLEKVGRSLVRCIYLYHAEDYPVAWSFVFYRSEDDGEWNVISTQFNVDYDKLPATP